MRVFWKAQVGILNTRDVNALYGQLEYERLFTKAPARSVSLLNKLHHLAVWKQKDFIARYADVAFFKISTRACFSIID